MLLCPVSLWLSAAPDCPSPWLCVPSVARPAAAMAAGEACLATGGVCALLWLCPSAWFGWSDWPSPFW